MLDMTTLGWPGRITSTQTNNTWCYFKNISLYLTVHKSQSHHQCMHPTTQVTSHKSRSLWSTFPNINTRFSSVWHCGYSIGEEGGGCFAFHWFVVCVLYIMVYLLFLLVLLVGYVLWLWLFLDIFMSPPPPPTGRETYWFQCRSCWPQHWHWCQHRCDTFLSAQYLVNQRLHSYQIYMDIQLGHNEELIRFWWPWLNFEGHSSKKKLKICSGGHLLSLKTLLLVFIISQSFLYLCFHRPKSHQTSLIHQV